MKRTLYRRCHSDMDMDPATFKEWGGYALRCRECGRVPDHQSNPTFIDILKQKNLVADEIDGGTADIRVRTAGWIVVEHEVAKEGTADFRFIDPAPGTAILVCPGCTSLDS